MSDELRLAGLLCSRLCHDLVGPVSAISNGIEFLEDGDPGMREEAQRLLAMSSAQAARRLQLFRIAFGRSQPASLPPAAAAAAAADYLADKKIACDWPTPPEGAESPAERASVKLVLNMILLGAECLPRGGSIAARIEAAAPGLEVTVEADGPMVSFGDEPRRALALGHRKGDERALAELTPRHVIPFHAARLALALGATLTHGDPESAPLAFRAEIGSGKINATN